MRGEGVRGGVWTPLSEPTAVQAAQMPAVEADRKAPWLSGVTEEMANNVLKHADLEKWVT
jgi:hypothetical protein